MRPQSGFLLQSQLYVRQVDVVDMWDMQIFSFLWTCILCIQFMCLSLHHMASCAFQSALCIIMDAL